MSRLAKLIFVCALCCLGVGCGNDAYPHYTKEATLYAMAQAQYDHGDFAGASKILAEHSDVRDFLTDEVRLHLAIRRQLASGGSLENAETEQLLDQMHRYWKGNIDIQHYREYLKFHSVKPQLINGICPAEPRGKACECRIASVKDKLRRGAEFSEHFDIESAEWFGEYVQSTCPSPNATALYISALADRDLAAANRLMKTYSDTHEAAEMEGLVTQICSLKSFYVSFPNDSGISKMERAHSLQCR